MIPKLNVLGAQILYSAQEFHKKLLEAQGELSRFFFRMLFCLPTQGMEFSIFACFLSNFGSIFRGGTPSRPPGDT